MPNILRGFLPWILFFALSGHSNTSVEMATSAALISHIIFNHHALKKGFVLDWGTLLFFVLFSINVFILQYIAITNNGFLISNCALAVIAWISLIISKPFTLQYAKSHVALEVTKSPLFILINYILTVAWAILLSLMALPNLLEIYDPIKYASDINLGVSILLMLIGVWLTQKFPDWFADKLIDRKFNVDIKAIYEKQKTSDQDYTEFNVEHIAAKSDVKTQVIIVGAGPIGLASALLLQQHDIDVIVIEKHPGISFHPKARYISCRSMELFRKLGIEDVIKQYNLPEAQDFFGWFSQLTGKLYARVSKHSNYPAVSPCDEASCAQPYLERTLLNQFVENGGRVYFEAAVTDFSQNRDFVQVKATNRKTKEKHVFQGDYLLAADGAHSTIRQLLQIPMIGPDEINTVFSVYCEMDLHDVIEKDKLFSIAFIVRPNKPSPMILSIDGKNKWVFIFPSAGASVNSLKEIYTDEYIKKQIYDVVGRENILVKILSKNAWTLGAQVANQFEAGRTFLIGDCAHRFPPTGGMGMNSGLQDVDNLIWKLAYVVKGQASKGILETYALERIPVILKIMQWSLKNLQRIVRIQRQFDEKQVDHNHFQEHAQTQEEHLNKSGLDLGILYASDFIAKTDETKPNIPLDHYIPNTYPGARLPHFSLIKDGETISSLDLVSTHFSLLFYEKYITTAQSIDFKSIPTTLLTIGEESAIKEISPGSFKKLLGDQGANAIWVRPDGHIAWKGSLNAVSDIKNLSNLIALIGV